MKTLDEDDEELLGETPKVSDPVPFHDGTQVPSTVKPKWELKKLTTRHKRIVQLKVAGLERTDIAKLAKCTPEYVSMLLGQPLVQEYLKIQHDMVDQDLRDLCGPAVNTLRSSLDSPDDKVALAAAQTVLRANGKFTQSDDTPKTTAEDVVAQIFQIVNSNVQVNISPKE